ncbi:unnamed protein product [Mytilus coruscus]|uniref:Uncharacterized protein n=1 Tax=Mytilus coruscus TaxID=42192 RepID=A0A6J8DY53_MYTCO|nr:unnamed protein product [Mytilus coruscus]
MDNLEEYLNAFGDSSSDDDDPPILRDICEQEFDRIDDSTALTQLVFGFTEESQYNMDDSFNTGTTENSNDQIFHQLIRRNRSETSKSDTDFLKMGEEEAISKKEQCELLAKYFEDLAQSKDNVNFNNEKLPNCKKRCKIIKENAKASTNSGEVAITKEDIWKAINQLKLRKQQMNMT